MRDGKLGNAAAVLAVEAAFFALFVWFMLIQETWKIVSFLGFFVFLGVFFKKWKKGGDALTALFREMKGVAAAGFILLLLLLPFFFQKSPYLIHICWWLSHVALSGHVRPPASSTKELGIN